MAARLLQAVMECYTRHVVSGPPTVEEVLARADVSRATFYKYFNSVDEAIEQRASQLVDEMIDSLKDLVKAGKMRAILLFTVSVHLFLLRGVLDPTWAAFVARSDLLRAESLFWGLNMHLTAAHADGDMAFSDGEAARTLAVGTMREAIRVIAHTNAVRRDFVDETMTLILVGLGLDREAARLLVGEATIFIRGAAPDRLTWWRDPWITAAKE